MKRLRMIRPETGAMARIETIEGEQTPHARETGVAWRHHCGTLNDSAWPKDGEHATCTGCRTDIRPGQIEARYLLVETTDDRMTQET